MASRVERHAEPRVPLSKDRVLRAAVDLADVSGIESVTMRKLAQELGVEAMSLYYYVAKKDDLLDGIVDIVVGEMAAPSSGGDWKAAVRASAISAHKVLLRHRWACSLMFPPNKIGPARLRYMDALLRRLREAGFSARMTHHAYHALDSHIMGFTLWEAGYSSDKVNAEFEAAFMRAFPADRYPHLAEHLQQHITKAGRGDKSEFEFGLDLILDGLEKIRAA
jgi:AcrR family transcriptional regulator